MSFLDRIAFCNTYDLSGSIPLVVNNTGIGWVRSNFVERLRDCPDVFLIEDDAVTFQPHIETPYQRTDALKEVSPLWVGDGLITKLRQEFYPARTSWSAPDLFRLDRALVPLFGVRAYGVHLNGFLRDGENYMLWIGKRSSDRLVEPGKLDNLVAGGQPAHLSIAANLIKECEEEASLPATLASKAKAAGPITYCFDSVSGLKHDTLFCYDLELPHDFVPLNRDGEIESFRLMSVDDALALIARGEAFKFNVSLVILDFAIRHGILCPDMEPAYEQIVAGLHSPPPTRL